jgi:hypothetical protein
VRRAPVTAAKSVALPAVTVIAWVPARSCGCPTAAQVRLPVHQNWAVHDCAGRRGHRKPLASCRSLRPFSKCLVACFGNRHFAVEVDRPSRSRFEPLWMLARQTIARASIFSNCKRHQVEGVMMNTTKQRPRLLPRQHHYRPPGSTAPQAPRPALPAGPAGQAGFEKWADLPPEMMQGIIACLDPGDRIKMQVVSKQTHDIYNVMKNGTMKVGDRNLVQEEIAWKVKDKFKEMKKEVVHEFVEGLDADALTARKNELMIDIASIEYMKKLFPCEAQKAFDDTFLKVRRPKASHPA